MRKKSLTCANLLDSNVFRLGCWDVLTLGNKGNQRKQLDFFDTKNFDMGKVTLTLSHKSDINVKELAL